MENTLTEEQIQDIKNALQKVIEISEKICRVIIELAKQLWENLKQFILKNEKAIKYIKIYNKTHNNRIKKKQITKIIKLYENNKK